MAKRINRHQLDRLEEERKARVSKGWTRIIVGVVWWWLLSPLVWAFVSVIVGVLFAQALISMGLTKLPVQDVMEGVSTVMGRITFSVLTLASFLRGIYNIASGIALCAGASSEYERKKDRLLLLDAQRGEVSNDWDAANERREGVDPLGGMSYRSSNEVSPNEPPMSSQPLDGDIAGVLGLEPNQAAKPSPGPAGGLGQVQPPIQNPASPPIRQPPAPPQQGTPNPRWPPQAR